MAPRERTLKVTNPYNQETVCELRYDEGAALDAKAAAAREVFTEWRRLPLDERASRLREGLERFRADSEDIAREVTRQMGKPLREARGEVGTFFERAEHMLSIAAEALAPDILPAREGFHRRIEHAPCSVRKLIVSGRERAPCRNVRLVHAA